VEGWRPGVAPGPQGTGRWEWNAHCERLVERIAFNEGAGTAMGIQFVCPECGKRLKTSNDMAGKEGRCPGCLKVSVAPAVKDGSKRAEGKRSLDRHPHEGNKQ